MLAFDPESAKYWQSYSDFGFQLVIIGVVGESVELLFKTIPYFFKFTFPAWFDKCLLAVEWFFWIILCVGLAMEYRGSQQAFRISDRESDMAKIQIAQAGERAANTESNNWVLKTNFQVLQIQLGELQHSNLNLAIKLVEEEKENKVLALAFDTLRDKHANLEAKLIDTEKQAIVATQQAVSADPINHLVTSLRLDVFLAIDGTNEIESIMREWKPTEQRAALEKIYMRLRVASILPKNFTVGRDSSLGDLRCHAYDSQPYILRTGTNATIQYSMTYVWPSGDIFDKFGTRVWSSGTGITVKSFVEKIGSLDLVVFGVKKGARIVEGSCLLTINGSIRKQFKIPASAYDEFTVNCQILDGEAP